MLSVSLDKITSAQNPKIKAVIKLRSKRVRDQLSEYLIEGYRELMRAVSSNTKIEILFICEELFLKDNEKKLIDELEKRGVQIFSCAQSVFEKISYRDRPDGLLAVAKKSPIGLEEITFKNKNPFIVVAVSIEKPGNLGTILRSADAVGADAIIVVDRVTDIYNPNVVRASTGTLFTQPVVEATSEKTLEWLKENNIQIVTTSPRAKELYSQVDYQGPTAIIVGSEQYGLPKHWLESFDKNVFIPMLGHADSLNAATCTTLMLYEVLRQRQSL